MKIALNVEDMDPSSGGVEGYVHNLATYLIGMGHEVHLVTRHPFPINGAHLHPVGHIRWSKLADMIHFTLASRAILKKGSYDVIHGFGRTLYQDIYRSGGGCHHIYYLQSLKAIPRRYIRTLIAIERRIRPRNLLTRYIEGRIYRKRGGPVIIAVSKWVRSQLMERYDIPEEDVYVIYNGVDLKRFNPLNRQKEGLALRKKLGLEGTRTFLFVSNNFKLKGLPFLIQALGLIVHRNPQIPISLVVIGKDRADKYLKLARAVGAADRIVFTGGIKEGIEKWYGVGDCLVHPTFFDPFSNACLEALASGLPVITSKFNGVAEIINDGKEGFILSDPTSRDEIALRMEAFLEPSFLAEASRRARSIAEAYPIERNMKEVMDLYRIVISLKGKTAP